MATLPLVLARDDGGPEWAWTLSAVLLAFALVSLIFIHGGRNRSARVSELEGYSLSAALALWTLGIGALVALIFGIVLPSVIRLQTAYVAALWLMMVMLGAYFVRIAASLLTHKLDRQA